MSSYTYQDEDRVICIRENQGDAYVRTSKGKIHYYAIDIPPGERQAAAQALAGGGYDVLPRPGTHVKAGTLIGRVGSTGKSTGPRLTHTQLPTDGRLPTINPADVKVGDVVEVARVVVGTVADVHNNSTGTRSFLINQDGITQWMLVGSDATVRLVRRAEPDPEQVKALADAIDAAEEQGDGLYDTAQLARELVRRGVTVRKEN